MHEGLKRPLFHGGTNGRGFRAEVEQGEAGARAGDVGDLSPFCNSTHLWSTNYVEREWKHGCGTRKRVSKRAGGGWGDVDEDCIFFTGRRGGGEGGVGGEGK